MSPDEYCQQKTVQSGSSFYYSFLFLPPERRRAITALYAFCREVDDTVDDATDASLARIKLAWWRTEVSAMYAGTPTHPVMLVGRRRAPRIGLHSCAILYDAPRPRQSGLYMRRARQPITSQSCQASSGRRLNTS